MYFSYVVLKKMGELKKIEDFECFKVIHIRYLLVRQTQIQMVVLHAYSLRNEWFCYGVAENSFQGLIFTKGSIDTTKYILLSLIVLFGAIFYNGTYNFVVINYILHTM